MDAVCDALLLFRVSAPVVSLFLRSINYGPFTMCCAKHLLSFFIWLLPFMTKSENLCCWTFLPFSVVVEVSDMGNVNKSRKH